MSQALARIRPDMLVVYADRFEGFAAIIAGTQMGIPTVHIEGGDVTEGGALDDSVRHAMSKLAHLHLTTNEQASNRIMAMGEEQWRVHTVGFPVIDLIVNGVYARPEELRQRLSIDIERPLILVTQHSVTTEAEQAVEQTRPVVAAIRRLAVDGVQCLVTYPNNDAGGRRIAAELQRLAAEKLSHVFVQQSIGRYNYHGVLALARDPNRRIACVGNSSSGIKETPAFGCPTVNIGSRQQSRLRSTNVLDTGYDADEIYHAVQRCLYDDAFRAQCRDCVNPYGIGNTGPRTAEILADVPLDTKLLRKLMTIRGERRDDWFR
jgi:UDP-N-acetylglucosamine 2-epimerase (non-hydrolysing)/GDP/UDP-N,N'-diacetylbacillosamine 2-epimerase (hydrolysing)